MNKTKKIMRKRVGAMALAITLSCWLPGAALAEETDDSVQTKAQAETQSDQEQAQKISASEQQASQEIEKEQAVDQNSASKAENKSAITINTTQQASNVPIAEVEVQADKDKKKLTIGQQEDAEGVKDYVITGSYVGSKSDVKSKDVPQSITSVGQKIIEEQNYTDINQLLLNVAGVTLQNMPSYSTGENNAVRGFGYGFDSYGTVNGLWSPTTTAAGWVGNLDRIEVLKGPAGVLYGNGNPGGLINYVTKKPLPYNNFTTVTEFRSWGGRSEKIDWSVPLTKDKKWLSRTIVQRSDNASFYKDVKYKNLDGSVMVQGQPRDDTTYTFEVQFHDHYGPTDAGCVSRSLWGIVPYDANYYNPNAKRHYISRGISAQVEHKFNDSWSIRSGLNYGNASTDTFSQGGTSLESGSTTTIRQSWYKRLRKTKSLAWDTSVEGHFNAWGLKHNLVTGFTWAKLDYDTPYYVRGKTNLPGVSMYDPVFATTLNEGVARSWDPYTNRRSGAYVNDIMEISPKFKVSSGVSYTNRKTYDASTSQTGSSWRAGATYEMSPGVTFFTGYATSYEPLGKYTNDAGKVYNFDPETGSQIEAGVKYDLSNKASMTLSAYRIRRQNLVYYLSDLDEYEQIGEQRSKGFEIDGTYAIQPGWNVLVAFSHCNSKVISGSRWAGHWLPAVPLHTFRLWSTYEIQEGPRKGLGFGGGVTYYGRAALTYNNASGWAPAYTLIDGVVYYKTKDWRYSLNFYNLTNKKYILYGGNSVYAGPPRSFALSIERSFN
ncbi:Ferrichrome-iron receptor precursor [Sporomusa ovata DSM 2662]|uniref:Ferrichrome-iron receptor n=1 Tax=Sporomusa ovata TaxID=2378 RepID=A0A0U1KS82_9FIRM|nr:TonB-dependent receptor [Sporomusa ovata]EQB26186.1 ferrichrysobactin receptor [Sporomusa ovata DSM 2662]CQR70262.1 Ferrichrome-iron receptor [Sporomusa ovata]